MHELHVYVYYGFGVARARGYISDRTRRVLFYIKGNCDCMNHDIRSPALLCLCFFFRY